MLNRIAVSITSPEKEAIGRKLATKLHVDFVDDPMGEKAATYDYLLLITPQYLGLQKTTDKKLAPFHIDFLSGKMGYRSQKASLRNELLARAIGFKPRENPTIIDATAGLGRDSFILASLGFQITMLERSPILFELLNDAILRASSDNLTKKIISRMQLIEMDSIWWLKHKLPKKKPDVIYLDPMFPERQKSASVKKEMVILQELLGKDADMDELFNLALTCANHRVVVKRPRKSTPIAGQKPSFSMLGKQCRFDIYLTSIHRN